MTPRVRLRAAALICLEGMVIDKYDLALAAHCDHRSAQRALAKLHGNGVRIAEWRPIYKQRIPAYGAGTAPDAKKPVRDPVAANRRRRNDTEVRMNEAAAKRAKRFREKMKGVSNAI